MASLINNHTLRRLILPLFAKINPGNITIRHHFTDQKFYLHSFRHKNYWVHGKKREQTTMDLFEILIDFGDTVIELGAHIGYISLYFAKLVGDNGNVVVFEPGPDNFKYLYRNVSQNKNITAIQKAVSDADGELPFYVEAFSGQNNSLIENFQGLSLNSSHANVESHYETIIVDVITLDTYTEEISDIQFLKIDVEGAELKVLNGAKHTIQRFQPIIMVESVFNNQSILNFFRDIDYVLFSPEAGIIQQVDDMKNLNYFCLHPEIHQDKYIKLQNFIENKVI